MSCCTFSTLLAFAILGAVACKQEAAPAPEEKANTKVNAAVSQTPYPTSQPTVDPDEEESATKVDSGSGCSSSKCKDPGTLEIRANGDIVTTLVLNAQSPSTTLTVKSTRFEDRTFKLHVTSEDSSMKVTANDAESVSLTWNQNGGTASQGTISIKARDVQKCDMEGGSSCEDFAETSSSDEDLSLPWSNNGSVGSGGSGKDNSNNMALSFGLQILAQILGLNIGQPGFGGNVPGGGQTFGGGAGNGWGGQQMNQFGNGPSGFGGQGNGMGPGQGGNSFGQTGSQWGQGVGTTGTGLGGTSATGTCSALNCIDCKFKTNCDSAQCTWSPTQKTCS